MCMYIYILYNTYICISLCFYSCAHDFSIAPACLNASQCENSEFMILCISHLGHIYTIYQPFISIGCRCASSPGSLRGWNLALALASLAVDAGFSWGTGESQVWTMHTSASPIGVVRLHSGWVGTLETQRFQRIFENILRLVFSF